MRISLCCDQFDLYFAPERSRGPIESRECDRCVFWIEQSVNRSARRSHTRSHRALVHPLLFH